MKYRAWPILVLLLAPWVAAPKCIDPDPVLTGMLDASEGGHADAAVSDEDGGPVPDSGSVRDSGVVPATACSEPGTARLRIRDFQYQIQCGCRESTGKTCTISAGTRVVWTFGDSEEHDVASVANGFPPSGERSSGTFSHIFSVPGDFSYLCNIHAVEMNGYTISVR